MSKTGVDLERKINEVNSSVKEVEITLTNEELQPHYDKALREIQPNVEIKGFRKGKVPLNVIKQRYGAAIEAESLENISNDEFQKFVKEEEIKVVGSPGLIDIKKSKDGVSFVIRYEVLPEFELKLYREMLIDEPIYNVTEDDIDEQVSMVCKNSGDLEPADIVENDEFVVGVKIYELDKNSGMPILGKDAQTTHFYLADQRVMPTMKDRLINAKIGDSFNYRPKDEGDPSAPDNEFKITVFEIKRLVPKELSEDFIMEYTKGKFETIDDFRQEINFNLQEQWDQKTREMIEEQIINKLVDAHEFDLPESVVHDAQHHMAEDFKKQYANTPAGKDLDVHKFAHTLKPIAERTVKWEIIRKAIIEHEDIKVEEFDIDDLAEEHANKMNSDIETIKMAIMNNPQITNQIINKKVLDLIIDFAETNEMSFEDYEAKYRVEQHDHVHDHNHDHDHSHEHPKSNIILP